MNASSTVIGCILILLHQYVPVHPLGWIISRSNEQAVANYVQRDPTVQCTVQSYTVPVTFHSLLSYAENTGPRPRRAGLAANVVTAIYD